MSQEEIMVGCSKEEALAELPTRTLDGEQVVYKDFEDLESMIRRLMLGGAILISSGVKSSRVGRNLG